MSDTTKEYVPDFTSGYIDPSAIIDPKTPYEDVVLGGSTVMVEDAVKISELKAINVDSSSWMHDNPTSAKIDLESVAYQVSNSSLFPEMKVSVIDLSTGQYVDQDLR